MTEIDVIVPVYGHFPMVRQAIESLLRQTVPVNVIVVDDCSPDDTAEQLENHFPALTTIRQERNRGFAAAANAGLDAGTGDIVILLNSDVVAEPEMAESLTRPFEDADVGSVAALLVTPDGTIDSFGITADPTGAGFVRFHGAALADIADLRPEARLLGPYGAVAAYRRSALEAIGSFDESIFMYGEELDVAFRLARAGWRCAAVDAVAGMHVGGASSGVGSARQRYLAGFGRGYLLRVYGVLQTRLAVRAIAVELIVCLRQLLLLRDVAALRGRLRGWRAGTGKKKRELPQAELDPAIDMIRSLRMRSPNYWSRFDG